MTERPILFSAPMVRAIQNDTKTQTRRIVKPQPVDYDFGSGGVLPAFVPPQTKDGYLGVGVHVIKKGDTAYLKKLPYGIPGDRLWVREAWLPARHGSYEPIERGDRWVDLKSKWSCVIVHRADYQYGHDEYDGHWRPSIHMPRWASRITLEITDVRVERLNSISEADAEAEGIKTPCVADFMPCLVEDISRPYACAYADLWEKINGLNSWNANPFVWCVSFRRIS